MANAKLEQEGRELTARLAAFAKDFEQNESITEDEKETAYKTLQGEFESYQIKLGRSEGASAMREKLAAGGCGDVVDAKGAKAPKFEMANPWTTAGRKALAAEFASADEVQAVFGFKDGFRKKMDAVLELGVKDATEAGNVLGEGGFGADLPPTFTGAPTQPFLPGAFGPGILPDWRPGIVETLLYKLTIADLISSFGTSSPVISYLTETNLNLTANGVAEALSGTNAWPFSSTQVAREYAQVGKIANALTISDEAVADAPTLYNFVQGRLLTGLQRQEEVQILAGPGYPGVGGLLGFNGGFTQSSANSVFGLSTVAAAPVSFPPTTAANGAVAGQGVVPQSVSLAYGRQVVGKGSGTYPDPLTVSLNLKDAFVDIELAVFETPNAVVMHPRDWQRLVTAQDANQQFMNTSMFGNVYGVSRGPVESLWGVPVITTPLMPIGTILTGWFDAQTVQVARRQGVQMQMTNSNESDFVQGKITVRADERLGLLCYRPSAFEVINLVPGS